MKKHFSASSAAGCLCERINGCQTKKTGRQRKEKRKMNMMKEMEMEELMKVSGGDGVNIHTCDDDEEEEGGAIGGW